MQTVRLIKHLNQSERHHVVTNGSVYDNGQLPDIFWTIKKHLTSQTKFDQMNFLHIINRKVIEFLINKLIKTRRCMCYNGVMQHVQ